ncbi:glycosyltransferase family 2 protein [Henriciella marina]|uniref:glycosyltransferase family 2 protein n=1 Tax=Henriciella marina TaxID=453851 RepID=UPI000363504D|nr:glycosyltransferase family 2 protein [Henriciella marina]
MTPSRELSVLIPFYNEAGNAAPLIAEIRTALDGIDYEIVCVNDCSDDTTGEELEAARLEMPDRIIVRTHVRRAGKSAALMTGLREVNGTWTQLLDGDGQNDIADTRRLWDAIVAPGNTGRLGLIAGKRKSRNDSGFKWLQSRVANGVRRFLLRDDATDTGCGWKLMRTDAFRELPYFASMHRFLPALFKRAGWEVREERVNDRRRWHGSSKYGFFGRLGAGIADLIGMFWLVRRGQPGIAKEWNDPRANVQSSEAKKSS